MSIESVVTHHLEALAKGDLEATMQDYAEDCVFIGNGRVVEGKAGIRAVFQSALATGPFAVTLKESLYCGNAALINWEVPGVIRFGTDTFVIENDRIVLQTNALVFGA